MIIIPFPTWSALSDDEETLAEELNQILFEKKGMILLTGRCSSLFDGRIKSELGETNRVLIIKMDGSILLHGATGTKPDQWQRKNVGSIKFTLKDEILQMESYRPKTDESFFISFSEIHSAFCYKTDTSSKAVSSIMGDEKDFVEYLVNNVNLIEEGLIILERESISDVGFVDILAKDKNGKIVIIEVKKQSANPADAYQLERYVNYYEKIENLPIRGILIANSFPKKVKTYLKAKNLEYCIIPWQKVFPTLERPENTIRPQKLENYFE